MSYFRFRLCNYPPVISKVMQSVNCRRSLSRSPAAARLNTPWTSAIHFKLSLQIVIANNGVMLGSVFRVLCSPFRVGLHAANSYEYLQPRANRPNSLLSMFKVELWRETLPCEKKTKLLFVCISSSLLGAEVCVGSYATG